MSNIKDYSQTTFEYIKHLTEDGVEFWYARELQKVLEYMEWRNFLTVVDKAKAATLNSDISIDDHFVDVTNMVGLGYCL